MLTIKLCDLQFVSAFNGEFITFIPKSSLKLDIEIGDFFSLEYRELHLICCEVISIIILDNGNRVIQAIEGISMSSGS